MRTRPAALRTVLARLRASTRLAVLVLLVFALKIGAVAACTQSDFAELDFGGGVGKGQAAGIHAPAGDKSTAPDQAKRVSVGACQHCSCHIAAMPAPDTGVMFSGLPQ